MSSVHIRQFVTIVAAFILVSCGGGHDPVPLVFNATLTSQQEVPPTASTAFGTGVVTVDTDRRTLIASVITVGIADTQVLLHVGAPGSVGPALVALTKSPGNTVWTASTSITESQLAALRAGTYYFNAYSAAFPTGEIRGQIIEQFPSSQQLAMLHQVSAQSPLVQRQLQQVEHIEDAWDGPFVGIGLSLGF